MAKDDALKAYRAKRNFSITAEPADGGNSVEGALQFVVQKHWASHLHYDFRLELDGTMKSWAVPKGPSYDPAVKRMAVQVEDHPISYNKFEGTIPEKQYGAGKVIIWDKGTWLPIGDAAQGYRDGKLKFELRGHKLKGHWTLVRMKGKGEKQAPCCSSRSVTSWPGRPASSAWWMSCRTAWPNLPSRRARPRAPAALPGRLPWPNPHPLQRKKRPPNP